MYIVDSRHLEFHMCTTFEYTYLTFTKQVTGATGVLSLSTIVLNSRDW